ncbi:MAG: peptide chain release factor N(5)-glutamine methyltransferase [Rickettsiales bacterium]|jgi:release factor glutamine methyltransferase|nr:peptide chain release factor N(5)-glutamine methyltransferase [Rickettsiales bacterium]
MTDNQAFAFLRRFAPAHDAKVVLENKKVGFWNILRIAFRLRRGVPVAKIIHKKWFYGLPFYTNRHTLDPRPDSETLVEAVIRNENPRRILDLGTGTGCLLCAIMKNIPNAVGVGIDCSRRACHVARRNAKDLGLRNRIKILRGTFSNANARDFDIVVANPPYIPDGDPRVNRGARRDPKTALYGGHDGLRYYRQIARLRTNAKIYIEIGAGQGAAVKRIFSAAGWKPMARYKDLTGCIRVLAFAG